MKYRVDRASSHYDIDVQFSDAGCIVTAPDGTRHSFAIEHRSDGSAQVRTPWGTFEVESVLRDAELWASVRGTGPPRRLSAKVGRLRPSSLGGAQSVAAGAVIAPMAGKLLRVDVALGTRVKCGQALAVIEAMKMENELVAPIDGVVAEVAISAPAAVDKGALILRLEPA